MTYVILNKPNQQQQNEVNTADQKQNELYNKYLNSYKTLTKTQREKLWDQYLKALKEYNKLFEKYIGYIY